MDRCQRALEPMPRLRAKVVRGFGAELSIRSGLPVGKRGSDGLKTGLETFERAWSDVNLEAHAAVLRSREQVIGVSHREHGDPWDAGWSRRVRHAGWDVAEPEKLGAEAGWQPVLA